jgi:hypothetical protein
MSSLYDEYRKFEFDQFNALESDNPTIIPKTGEDLYDTLIDAYINGFRSAAYILGVSDTGMSPQRAAEVAMASVAGETFEERLAEYDGQSMSEARDNVQKIVVTEIHRAFVQGQLDMAQKAGAKTKTWDATMDNVTRDTHYTLDGTEIPLDDYFVTPYGEALAPGLFGVGQEDCNCRCILSFSF